jgi:RNA-directed DNA polymerase
MRWIECWSERGRSRNGKYTYIEYARFADDLVILIDAYKRHDWLVGAVDKRLREEFGKLQVEINDEKSRIVDLERGCGNSKRFSADTGRNRSNG